MGIIVIIIIIVISVEVTKLFKNTALTGSIVENTCRLHCRNIKHLT